MSEQTSQINLTSTTTRADQAAGDLLFTGLATTAMWNLLVAKGLLKKGDAIDTLDTVLLTIEQRRETWGGNAATLDQARKRLEALIEQIHALPG